MENQTRNRHEYGSVSGRFPCQVCRPLSSVTFYHRHHSIRTMLNAMHAQDVHTIECLVCKTALHISKMIRTRGLLLFFQLAHFKTLCLCMSLKLNLPTASTSRQFALDYINEIIVKMNKLLGY